MTLTDFLLARIAEDEERARYVAGVSVSAHRRWHQHAEGNLDEVTPDGWSEPFMPARVLAECEAKRQIVELPGQIQWAGESVVNRLLALPYADHPDYREEWRP